MEEIFVIYLEQSIRNVRPALSNGKNSDSIYIAVEEHELRRKKQLFVTNSNNL